MHNFVKRMAFSQALLLIIVLSLLSQCNLFSAATEVAPVSDHIIEGKTLIAPGLQIFYSDSDNVVIYPQSIDNHYYLFLPADSNYENLPLYGNACILGSTSDCAALSDGNVNLPDLIGEPMYAGQTYTFHLSTQDGISSADLTFMKADSLSSLHLTSDKTIDEINSSKDISGAGTATMISCDGICILAPAPDESNLTKLKGRGNTGWEMSGEKKPYAITLSSKKELISGAGKSKKWNLISDNCQSSLVQEAAGLENIAAYHIYQEIDGAFPMSFEPINLYINGEYRGVYLLTEKVEIASTRVDIGSYENDEDESSTTVIVREGGLQIYPGLWPSVPTERIQYVSVSEDPTLLSGIQAYSYATGSIGDSLGDGGFLLELDGRFYSEPSWFVTRRGYAYVLKEPEFATRAQVQLISKYVQEYEDAVFSNTGYNSCGKYYTEYIDLDSIVRKIAVDLFTDQVDQFVSSCFFCVDVKDGVCAPIIAGPAWDYDGSNYTSDFTENLSVRYENFSSGGKLLSNTQYMEIMFLKHGDFSKRLYSLVTGPLSEVLNDLSSSIIPDYIDAIGASQNMNSVLWNYDGTNPRSAQFEEFYDRFSIRCSNWLTVWKDDSYLRGITAVNTNGVLLAENSAGCSTISYQWYRLSDDLTTGYPISGATQRTFIPTETGKYYVVANGSSLPKLRTGTMYSNPVSYCVIHNYQYINNGADHTMLCAFCGNTITQSHSFEGGCCVCGAEDETLDTKLEFMQEALSLESAIKTQFIVNAASLSSKYGYTDFKVSYTHIQAGGSKLTFEPDSVNYGSRFRIFEIETRSIEMCDTFLITLYGYKNGTWYHSEEVSWVIRDAAMASLGSTSSTASMKTLLASMLNYGATAQLYFEYNIENLANGLMSPEQAAFAKTSPDKALVSHASVIASGTPGTKLQTALSLSSAIELQFIFNGLDDFAANDLDAHITYTLMGIDYDVVVPVVAQENHKIVCFAGLKSNEMRARVTCELFANDVSVSEKVVYSAETYAYEAASSTSISQITKDLANAMICYIDASIEYFG